MVSTIGLIAQVEHYQWLEILKDYRPAHILDVATTADIPNAAVQSWLVIPNQRTSLASQTVWLQQLNAPIILVMNKPRTALQYAPSIRNLAFVCHPARWRKIKDLLYLAAHWTGGVHIVDYHPPIAPVSRGLYAE